MEVQGDGFIRRLQGYYCPNKHLLCQTWSTAAARRPPASIWISISLPPSPFGLSHFLQPWIAHCAGLLHFFHLNRLHQAPDFLPTTLLPTSAAFRKLWHLWGLDFFPLPGTGCSPRFHYRDAGCHCCPEQGSHGMHISSPWTGKLSKARSNSDKLFGKLLNLYHFLLSYTHIILQAHKQPHKRQSTGNIPAASLQDPLKNMDRVSPNNKSWGFLRVEQQENSRTSFYR